MATNRSLTRNVMFYNANHPDMALGGLVQNGSITEANFLDILGILLITKASPIRVQERMSGHIISETEAPLQTGVYDIYCDATIQVSDEPWTPRLIAPEISGRDSGFLNDVRNRDRKCVISGISIPEILIQSNNWTTFEATHIFPPEHEPLWIRDNYGRWIVGRDNATESSKICSPQNGFLLRSHLRQMFDGYLISINPDDAYKIVVFDIDIDGYDGRILDPVCRNPADPHRVSDQLLRWHFRQSVLANARGAGEPIFEHDFPPGTDIVGEIHAGPYARERFELEIAARLRVVS
ncbi:hypothetical protein HOY80DRAFT_1043990 [Tuber brumale]|nr:hypothetical protein HOY80DRAFT_1043990 [Tuber brumale]